MNLRSEMDILVHDFSGSVAPIIAAFHDFEQIGGFEVASAENSGTTDSGVSDEGRSIPPIYLHIW